MDQDNITNDKTRLISIVQDRICYVGPQKKTMHLKNIKAGHIQVYIVV